MTIGSRIRAARRALNMTQADLAHTIGVEQQTVSGWETDPHRRPQRDIMPRIAKALRRDVNWLERGGASDGGRAWSDETPNPAAAQEAAHRAPIDHDMLARAVAMALDAALKPYGVTLPRVKIEDVADAAISAYQTYQRLAETDDAA